ncbi:MAG: hypothetical protein F4137_16825 [Acidobacteria bacterium]|nr:hypothetical protein [Acidobacteriota bacterium]
MTKDTWAIIGTMVTIGSIVVALGAIAINQNSQLNTRISDLNNDFNTRISDLRAEMNSRFAEMNGRFTDLDGDVDNLRTDVRQMGDRLRAVEVEFAKVDQRLLTLERAVIPIAEGDD